MSTYGKYNLLGMLALPVIAALGSVAAFGSRLDTQLFVFGTHIVPMLIGGLFSALLLRSAAKAGGRGTLLALSPTLVPAAAMVAWYAVTGLTSSGDPGREYFAGPFYLLGGVFLVGIAALVGSLLTRRTG